LNTFIYERSRNHSYGDPDIEDEKVAQRTFIKHHPAEVRATIKIAEHEFNIRRVDEITKYEYKTYTYRTFETSAWPMPSKSDKRECTTTYGFRIFADEEAFIVSTSPSSKITSHTLSLT
jgi:hypothetical protein